MVPLKIASDIRLPLSPKTYQVGGIGGSMRVRRSVVAVTLTDDVETTTLSRVTTYVPVDQRFGLLILGRKDVFAHFRILLDEAGRRITLDPRGRARTDRVPRGQRE